MNMTDDPTMQSLKGKLKKVQGEIKTRMGNELGGTIDKLEGEAEEKIAEARLRFSRKPAQKTVEELKKEEAREQAVKDLDNY